MEGKNTFTLDPRRITYFLVVIGIILALAHLIGVFMVYVFGFPKVFGLVNFFNLDKEQNAPTLFSTCLFLINAILFFIIWKLQRLPNKSEITWLFLSALFIFLAFDEFGEIHETLERPVKEVIHTSGFLAFAWVIPYGIASILLLLCLFSFLRKLNKKIRNLFYLSALSYFVGAIGFEMIGAWYVSLGDCNIVCGLLILVEESLEMTGLIILTYALLSLLQSKHMGLKLIIPASNIEIINKPVYQMEKKVSIEFKNKR